jgi:plastocyanin
MTAVAIVLAIVPVAASGASAPPLWTHGMFTASSQQIGFTIKPGLDDEQVSISNFAVRPGDPVTVTVSNYTPKAHTFTAPGLGISALIPAGSRSHPSTSVFTFTATRIGTFHWFCATPCGNSMSGTIYALIRI